MKIAVATDDGVSVGRHFGQATGYIVYTVSEGRVVGRELRAKPACDHHSGAEGGEASPSHDQEPAGSEGRDLHGEMTDVIADCEAVAAGAIPPPMVRHLVARGIRPLVTDITLADEAVSAFLAASG